MWKHADVFGSVLGHAWDALDESALHWFSTTLRHVRAENITHEFSGRQKTNILAFASIHWHIYTFTILQNVHVHRSRTPRLCRFRTKPSTAWWPAIKPTDCDSFWQRHTTTLPFLSDTLKYTEKIFILIIEIMLNVTGHEHDHWDRLFFFRQADRLHFSSIRKHSYHMFFCIRMSFCICLQSPIFFTAGCPAMLRESAARCQALFCCFVIFAPPPHSLKTLDGS